MHIDKARTTIRVKIGTRNLIQDRSLPGESLEDTIVRIINENDMRSKEIDRFTELMKLHNIKEPNLISEYSRKREKDILETDDGILIEYSYNVPADNLREYSMEIMIERIVSDNNLTSFDEIDLNEKERSRIYFLMIERIINEYFDKAFSLPMKKNIKDPRYWKRVSKRVGLPDSSYMRDILKVIEEG